MWKSIDVPIRTTVGTAIFENTEVPNPTSAEVPIKLEASTGGSRGEGSQPANVEAPIRYQRQADPLRHLADPEVINEER